MSSMLAVNDSRLMVVLPSGDFCSSACFSLVTPIHQVMAAGGWPIITHLMAIEDQIRSCPPLH
ncbi:hypothetical protein TYRP_000164 [Tyrophagus putrescentiae]|nr:hypothetical protein TYRP_000164 [Tyrophagus putrescentiae]